MPPEAHAVGSPSTKCSALNSAEYSESTAQSIDQEVRRILTDAYGRAKQILKTNLSSLHSMAEALLEQEVLDGKAIDEIISANGGDLPAGAIG